MSASYHSNRIYSRGCDEQASHRFGKRKSCENRVVLRAIQLTAFCVMIQVLIWDKHASPLGIAALCVCLCGGALYEQAPLRRPKGYEPVVHAASIAPMDTTASADHDDPRTSEP